MIIIICLYNSPSFLVQLMQCMKDEWIEKDGWFYFLKESEVYNRRHN